MIKLYIVEDSSDGKFTHQGVIRIEPSERVHAIEVSAMLQTITSKPFQEEVRAMLREICDKNHIPVSEIVGL